MDNSSHRYLEYPMTCLLKESISNSYGLVSIFISLKNKQTNQNKTYKQKTTVFTLLLQNYEYFSDIQVIFKRRKKQEKQEPIHKRNLMSLKNCHLKIFPTGAFHTVSYVFRAD